MIVDHLDASANTNGDVWPSITPDTYSVFGDELQSTTVTTDERRKLVLLRRRIQAVAKSSIHNSFATIEPDALLDGVMLWIEPDRN